MIITKAAYLRSVTINELCYWSPVWGSVYRGQEGTQRKQKMNVEFNQDRKKTQKDRNGCWHTWGWEVNLIKAVVERDKRNKGTERERMTEGVPLPSVQPSSLTSQAKRHKTRRSQLSSSLDFHLHTRTPARIRACPQTRRSTRSDLSRYARAPPRPETALWQQENHLVSHSSGLKHALSLVLWCLILCEAPDTVGRKRALQPRLSPLLKKQQMWQKRGGGERNTILLTPPSLIWENNTQLPAGVGQLLSPSQSSRSRA